MLLKALHELKLTLLLPPCSLALTGRAGGGMSACASAKQIQSLSLHIGNILLKSIAEWPPVMLVKLARTVSLSLRFFGFLHKVWLLHWHSPRTILLGDGFDRVLCSSSNRRRHQIDIFDLLGQRVLCHFNFNLIHTLMMILAGHYSSTLAHCF